MSCHRWTLWAARLAVIAAVACQGCRRAPQRPNVLLITIDTCRADHLGCYGCVGAMTKTLDGLAKEGVVFTHAVSPVPLTLPAHASILTGTIPPRHGVHDNLHYRLGDDEVTLAETLKAHGYATSAAVGAFVLDRQFGLAQGFDTYDDDMSGGLTIVGGHAERRGERVSRFAVDWLEKRASKSFFLFLHFYDPHHPYRPPGRFGEVFAGDPYAGEIAYVDECIGEVLASLKRLGLYESTLVIVTADHGEGRGDHGEQLHGYFIYHSTTRVPLLIKPPGDPVAKRISDPVGLIDIAPTILAQVGVDAPPNVSGRDLSPYFSGAAAPTRAPFYFSESLSPTKYECNALFAIEDDAWRYIQTTRPELYDLSRDPNERTNLFDREPQRAKTMRARLRSLLDRSLRAGPGSSAASPDATAVRRLRELGYSGTAVAESFQFDDDLVDPKDFLVQFADIESAKLAIGRKEFDRARELCERILSARPDLPYAHSLLGQIAFFEGNVPEAIRRYETAVRLKPDAPDWHNDLGLFLGQVGRWHDAIEHFRAAIRSLIGRDDLPQDTGVLGRSPGRALLPQLFLHLADALAHEKDKEQAERAYRDALRLDPGNANARTRLATLLTGLGRTEEADQLRMNAQRMDPKNTGGRRTPDRDSTDDAASGG